jgi:hypothetical protein
MTKIFLKTMWGMFILTLLIGFAAFSLHYPVFLFLNLFALVCFAVGNALWLWNRGTDEYGY